MPINNFADGELITAPRLNEMVGQLNTRYYTIDQTAGRVVKVWDYLNNREQMIYGDTGSRNISSLGASITSGTVLISRETNIVQITLAGVVTSQTGAFTLMTLPSGFRPTEFIYGVTVKYWSNESAEEMRINTNGAIEFRTVDAGAGLSITLRYRTRDPWPVTLPGAA